MTAVEVAPGVLRRRWCLELTHLRALERWAAYVEHNEAIVPIPIQSLRTQAISEFGTAGRLAK